MTFEPVHLRGGGTSVVLVQDRPGLPRVAYWGDDLGDASPQVLAAAGRAGLPQRVSGGLDLTALPSLLPLGSEGWQYAPGLEGSDDEGGRTAPDLAVTGVEADSSTVRITAEDRLVGLGVELEARVDGAGLLHQSARVVNLGATAWRLDRLVLGFPLPPSAQELLDCTGRHLKERSPQRHRFTIGEHVRSSRRGRPGSDGTVLLVAGEAGFGFRSGRCHAVSVAWSGNQRIEALRTPTGEALLSAGELLLPGEVRLAPGTTYASPVVTGSWGDGLDRLGARFHAALRDRPGHPAGPRPVTLNTWEAVYFDQDLGRLTALADAGAAVGVERFVLDDGWFRGRRDDTSALGDWQVDAAVWPDGLSGLIDHVHGAGMQFGLWVEPEMVSPDSDLARAHPEWMLGPAHRDPLPGRQQQVLDLSNGDVVDHLVGVLDDLLQQHPIDYLKWDHNRDLIEAVDRRAGRNAVHGTTAGLYALLDELRRRHPGLEIESCASGGARVDLGILQRTDRIWVSDCIDPLERLDNQAYTNLVVPYELMGAHVGALRSHSTDRVTDLDLQAAVALPGHFGIERDLTTATADELARIAAWVELHKRLRPLLHTGVAVRADALDPALDVRGVVSGDGGRAVFTIVQRAATTALPAGRVTLPGLLDDADYAVSVIGPAGVRGPGQSPLAWHDGDAPIVLPGRVLTTWGLQAPVLYPESAVVLELERR